MEESLLEQMDMRHEELFLGSIHANDLVEVSV